MLGVFGSKVLPDSHFAQQLPITLNNMQQGVQTDATCHIQECWELLATMLRPFARGFNELQVKMSQEIVVALRLPLNM